MQFVLEIGCISSGKFGGGWWFAFEGDSHLGNLTLWRDRCIVEVVQVACSVRCLRREFPDGMTSDLLFYMYREGLSFVGLL